MTSEQYRDLIDAASDLVTGYSSCVSQDERMKWLKRAEAMKMMLWAAEGGKLNDRYKTKEKRVRERLNKLVEELLPDAIAGKFEWPTGSGVNWQVS